MKWSVGQGHQFIKRLSQPVDFRRDIARYGKSNLYPQMISEVMFRSPITLSSVQALTDFTTGGGFQSNGDLIINENEQSLNDLLKTVSLSYSTFNGFALHFNVNELNMITEINQVKFEDVRYGLPDDNGEHKDVKINDNWENDSDKTIRRSTEVIDKFPLWQKRDKFVIEDIEEFQGFILYWTPIMDQYPKAMFDSVLDSAQTNGEIQVFELGNIQNGFQSASFFLHRGKIESETERQRILNDLRSMKGPENANSVQLFEVPIDFDSNILEPVAANNNDRLFELTNNNTRDRIIAAFGMPFPIIGIQPDGGIFNQQQIEDAYVFYNLRTRDRRSTISDTFNKFLRFWHEGEVNVGDIKESKFLIEGVQENEGKNDLEQGVDESRVETAGKSDDELRAQASLRGSVGGVQGILGIQASVADGLTSVSSAVSMLVEIYGFTEQVAIEILGVKEDGGDNDNS